MISAAVLTLLCVFPATYSDDENCGKEYGGCELDECDEWFKEILTDPERLDEYEEWSEKCQVPDCNSSGPTCDGGCEEGFRCVHDEDAASCRCEEEPPPCEETAAAQCNGSCDDDLICRTQDDGSCACVEPPPICEESAPDCDGECEDGLMCQTAAGGSGCECVQPDSCEESAPDCSGNCPEGTLCRSSGTGECVCEPPPPPCGDAADPECNGACDNGRVCQTTPDQRNCECVRPEPLCAHTAPECDGICADGGHCRASAQPGACECVIDPDSCEQSQFETCAGNCESGKICAPDVALQSCVCIDPPPECGDASSPECGGGCPDRLACASTPGGDACHCVPIYPTCDEAGPPQCIGTCHQGFCQFEKDSRSCICGPPRPPTPPKERARAVCPEALDSGLVLRLCRSPDPAESAHCGLTHEANACQTLWRIPYSEIDALDGEKDDIHRILAVPLWEWRRPGEWVDWLALPLEDNVSSYAPLPVFEGMAIEPPIGDIRVLLTTKSLDKVVVIRPDEPGEENAVAEEVRISPSRLAYEGLCGFAGSERCTSGKLAALRTTLIARDPGVRFLTEVQSSGESSGECVVTLDGADLPVLLCYQASCSSDEITQSVRAWEPMQAEWFGSDAAFQYVVGLRNNRELSALEVELFNQGATSGEEVLTVVATLGAPAASSDSPFERIPLPVGNPAGVPEYFLAWSEGRLKVFNADGERDIAVRSTSVLSRVATSDMANPRLTRWATALLMVEPTTVLLEALPTGSCFAYKGNVTSVECFKLPDDDTRPEVWEPIRSQWAKLGNLNVDEISLQLLEEGDNEGDLQSPVLASFFGTALSPSSPLVALADLFGDPMSSRSWSLAVPLNEGSGWLELCSGEIAFIPAVRSLSAMSRAEAVGPGGIDCQSLFLENYLRFKADVSDYLLSSRPSSVRGIYVGDDRALLTSVTGVGGEQLSTWVGTTPDRRVFAPVSKQRLLCAVKQSRRLTPDGTVPSYEEILRAVADPNWGDRGWRANPLGLVLEAVNCR